MKYFISMGFLMRAIAWAIFAIASGYIFWMMIIIGISYFHLNDVIRVDVELKEYPWVDFGSAIGTMLAAIGAVAASITALSIERRRSKREAEAKRSMSSFYLSDICFYLKYLFLQYQELWMLSHDDKEPTMDCVMNSKLIQEAQFKVPEFPRESADKLAQAVVFYWDVQTKAVQIFAGIQSIHSRAKSIEQTREEFLTSLLSDIEEIDPIYASACSLFAWARRREKDEGFVPPPQYSALSLMGANEDMLAAYAKFRQDQHE